MASSSRQNAPMTRTADLAANRSTRSTRDDAGAGEGIMKVKGSAIDCSGRTGPASLRQPFSHRISPDTMNLARALSFSRYAQRTLLARPALSDELIATLDAPFDWTKAAADIDAAAGAGDDAMLAATLRVLRRRVFLHTLARDLTGRAPFREVVHAMTTLAERALRAAVHLHSRALGELHGAPRGETSG